MTYHDNPGAPSGVYAHERNVCADEAEIAPGFGANMLAYLCRKAATPTPHVKKRQHLKLTPDKAVLPPVVEVSRSVKPKAAPKHKVVAKTPKIPKQKATPAYPQVRRCADCPGEFTAYNDTHVRCKTCQTKRRAAAKVVARKEYRQRKRSERLSVARCPYCGTEFVPRNGNQLYCSDLCCRAQEHKLRRYRRTADFDGVTA